MFYNTILNRGEFSALQQPFVKTSVLLRHSYSLAKGCLFCLAGISLLVLTACAGGSGGGSSAGGSTSAFKVELIFSPTANGFIIGNQSDFGNFVSLNITATTTSRGGRIKEDPNISIAEFSDDSYPFTVPFEANWTFKIIGTLSDGRQESVEIVFVWPENKLDHSNNGIRSGLNTDGDGRANSVDEDDDNDGINDTDGDDCPVGDIDWTSNSSTDNDNDGCQDADEDKDDDNDGVADTDPKEAQSNLDGDSCSLLEDCDGDTIRDIDEVAAECVIATDCDRDTIGDEVDACPVGVADWTPSASNDGDGDGCRNDEDIDDDGDGLIEIGTHQELNAVRYALNGNGSRSAANAVLDTTGCGGDGGITSCSGYELVANISLATYANADSGKGWQPLGHDIDGATAGCQGAAFNGIFEGNGFMISDLSISRSGEDCVGLFGHIAEGSEIRNLTLRSDTVIGEDDVGGLVGDGQGARIVSSSVVMKGIKGNRAVGGLVGWGEGARIHSSSVVVGEVEGIGSGRNNRQPIAGLVGWGQSATIISSSVVAGMISGNQRTGGLVGQGLSVRIYSSSVVASMISLIDDTVGGLVGQGRSIEIYSSSVVAAEVSAIDAVGGLVGVFTSGKVAYSYVVSGSSASMLVGLGNGAIGAASYWDSDTSKVSTGNHGQAKTSDDLQMPEGYDGIYATWNDDTDIFSDGMSDEPLAVWCDRDKSGSIEEDEKINDNLIWDFGGTNDYPAINCTPISPTEWRSWWSLVNGKPELNQMLLNQELNK